MTNPAYLTLMSQWDACIQLAGYTVEAPADGGGTHWEDSWTDEQLLQANITEAKCADDMNYTQQVGDIFAAYQMDYIKQHEAELVAIKQQADAAVAKAKQILIDAGVM